MDKVKLPILWSTKMAKEDIKKAAQDERINTLILCGKFMCRIGSLQDNQSDYIRRVMIDPSEPHGVISDLYCDKSGWYGDVFIPDVKGWPDFVNAMKDPVLHPSVNVDSDSNFRIVHFAIMERSHLDPNRTYDGIHRDTLEKRYGNKSVVDEIYKSTVLPFVNSVSKRSPSKSDDSTTPIQNMYKVTCSVGLDDDFILIRAASEIEAWNKFWEHFKDEPNLNHEDFGSKEEYEYIGGYWQRKRSTVSISIEAINTTSEFMYIGGGRNV